MVCDSGVIGPDVKLPLPQSDQPRQNTPGVDADPHVELLHVVLLPDAADEVDHVEAHLYTVLGVVLIADVLCLLVVGIRCREA